MCVHGVVAMQLREWGWAELSGLIPDREQRRGERVACRGRCQAGVGQTCRRCAGIRDRQALGLAVVILPCAWVERMQFSDLRPS